MSLSNTILEHVKEAMRSQDTARLGVLRLLSAELKNAEIEKGEALSDSDTLRIIRREVKKRRETARLYTESGHQEQATKELAEADILETYLPPAPDRATIRTYLEEEVRNLNEPLQPAHRGGLMRSAMQHFGEAADGRTISEILNELLNS